MKDIVLEWRQRYAINGILIYVLATVFIVYVSFISIDPVTWNVMFWIIMLFTAVNAIAKSFMQESESRQLYYYTIADPRSVIVAKMIYNCGLMIVIAVICLLSYILLTGNPILNMPLFVFNLILGGIGFSLTFTILSAISSKASGSATLMTILSFPVIIPMLLMLIKISASTMMPDGAEGTSERLITLAAIDVIIVTVAFLLFPYLWRD